MGTEYFLARPDNKTLFELGKSLINNAFYELQELEPGETGPIPRNLRRRISRALRDYDADYDWGDYANVVATGIHTWAQDQPVKFISENDDIAYEWERTGSRYE